jgi:putative chitinase
MENLIFRHISLLKDSILVGNKGGSEMDYNKLKGIIPNAVLIEIPLVIQKFEINTDLRLCHFLSQCAHESGGFKHTVENLNYSAKGLLTTFGKYFKQPGLAEAYARKPEKIASRVYGSRMGNGEESTGDGWKYRGRGYIQLTGKNNYTRFDSFVDDDIIKNPDLVATKYPLLSAAWFFGTNGLNKIADKGATDDTVKSVTKRVNGGFNGLNDRLNYFRKYYAVLK